ncbi:MAG: hypothetical protein Q7U70_10755 [Methylotenera sp.]|nr:hypothetical protein [Methylotenera sp.]
MSNTNYHSAEQSKKQNIVAMGEPLGELYSALWQHLTLLYNKWGDYVALFGTNPERIVLLNKTGASFFRTVQDCLWDDSLLHLARITDSSSTGKKHNLTIRRISELVNDVKQKAELEAFVDTAVKATAFARDWRNRRIAHRDLQLALDLPTEPLAVGARLKLPRCARCRITQSEGRLKMTSLLISVSHLCRIRCVLKSPVSTSTRS